MKGVISILMNTDTTLVIIILSAFIFSTLSTLTVYNVYVYGEVLKPKVNTSRNKKMRTKIEDDILKLLEVPKDKLEFETRKSEIKRSSLPPSISIKLAIMKLISNKDMKVGIFEYGLATVASILIGFTIGALTKNIIITTAFSITAAFIPYIVITIMNIYKRIALDQDLVSIIENHMSYYIKESGNENITFERALRDMLGSMKKSKNMCVKYFENMYHNIYTLNMSKQDAAEILKKDLNQNKFITEYLKRALYADVYPETKYSLHSVPKDYKDYIQVSKDKLQNTLDIYLTYTFILLVYPATFIFINSSFPQMGHWFSTTLIGNIIVFIGTSMLLLIGVAVYLIGKPPK